MADGKLSVALQDKLAKCERQLGDWQACPSGKTPEGKKIIQNLQSQIRSIESRMTGADNASTPQLVSVIARQESPKMPATSRANGQISIGGLIDVYA